VVSTYDLEKLKSVADVEAAWYYGSGSTKMVSLLSFNFKYICTGSVLTEFKDNIPDR
jgi:hypothetical protein